MSFIDRLVILTLSFGLGFSVAISEWGGAAFIGLLTLAYTFGPEIQRLQYGEERDSDERI